MHQACRAAARRFGIGARARVRLTHTVTGDDTPSRLRVLLVEDSEDDAELLLLELRRAGFECEPRRVDTAEGLEDALTRQEWDLVVSDFQMPAFDGLSAFRIYRKHELDAPFIFVSGVLGEERAVTAMRAGARDYILKGNLTRVAATVQRELQTAEDRRERQAMEEMARLEQERLAIAVEATGAGVFEHDLPVRRIYVSPRCAQILGHAPDDPVSADVDWVREHVHPDDWATARDAYAEFLTRRSERLECQLRTRGPSGEWIHVAVHAKLVGDPRADEPAKVVGVVHDLSDRHRLETQLRAAQKMEAVGRVAGGVAHDLNNILTIVFTFGGFVLEDLPDGSSAREDVEQIMEAAGKASRLTSQLLAFCSRKPVSPRVVRLNEVLEKLEPMIARAMGESIALECRFEPGIGNVRLDVDAFEQVVLNMAINAKHAMPDGGEFRVVTSSLRTDGSAGADEPDALPPGEYVLLALSDSGTGMDEETLDQIFEPFFTTKAPDKGTGLGLATCYGIIKQARGHIRVRSALGRGTTFEILLPAVGDGVQTPQRRRAPVSLTGTERILVVEDDAQLRDSTARLLAGFGYAVQTATNGREALALADAHGGEIDLVLTDLVMPEMSGARFVGMWADRFPDCAILIMSGYSTDEAIPNGEALGAPLLEKPFTGTELGLAVRELLDARAR